jgi:hypothetical protein
MKKGSQIISLEAATSDPLATRNTILFSALTAMNISPEVSLCGEYVETVNGRPRSVTVWRLRPVSECGRFQTMDLIAKWKDPDFVSREPEHPFAYIKQAFENHTRSLDFLKDQGPIVMRRRGRKIAFITRHTPEALRRQIIDELNKAA